MMEPMTKNRKADELMRDARNEAFEEAARYHETVLETCRANIKVTTGEVNTNLIVAACIHAQAAKDIRALKTITETDED